jgi:arylsulfatase A-like enzyme
MPDTRITRRSALRLAAAAAAQKAGGQPHRPNVVVLFTDDQRYDTIGALGHPDVRTPNMDALVRGGTTMTNACIMGGTIPAVCAPSRAMLLTGQSLFRVHDNIIDPKRTANTRPFVLFPEEMRNAGYTTYGIGKWHNGRPLFQRCFTDGDKIFFGGMSNQIKVPLTKYDKSGRYPDENRTVANKFSSEQFSDSAVRFLESYRGGDPFLLYVAYTSPHDPRMAPDQYMRLYDSARIQLPNFLPQHPFDNGEMKVRDDMLAPFPRTGEEIRKHIAGYYAMISEVDGQIGRVLRALETGRHASNTIVVFAGDNGLACGQHGLMGKQNLYDHSMRVPLVLRGPGIHAGHRDNSLCYLLDVCPTLLDAAGLSVSPHVEGQPLWKRPPRASVMAAYRHLQRAIRTDTHKLIEYNVGGERTTQLFDLKRDPWERQNVAGENAERVRGLRSDLRDWMRKAGDPVSLDSPTWQLT